MMRDHGASLPRPGFPTLTAAQLATAAANLPCGPGWVSEEQLDGYRVQVCARGEDVRIFTRGGLDWSSKFKALVAHLQTFATPDFVLDGELCALDPSGWSNFSLLCGQWI